MTDYKTPRMIDKIQYGIDSKVQHRTESAAQQMKSFSIVLADKKIELHVLHSYIKDYCKEYLVNGTEHIPVDFLVEILPSDIDFERQKSAHEDEIEGIPIRHFSDEYLETLAVYRKIAEQMIDYDTLLFHGSAIAVDGVGYLFTAKSGTGKSTHTRLWREQFGSRAAMVNDDKPLLKITDHGVTVYGTPWDGKHRLSSNISVPLKAICILNRGSENHSEPASKKDAWPLLLQQCYRPDDSVKMMKVLSMVDKLAEKVELYSLGCTMEPEAALVSYEGMNRTE